MATLRPWTGLTALAVAASLSGAPVAAEEVTTCVPDVACLTARAGVGEEAVDAGADTDGACVTASVVACPADAGAGGTVATGRRGNPHTYVGGCSRLDWGRGVFVVTASIAPALHGPGIPFARVDCDVYAAGRHRGSVVAFDRSPNLGWFLEDWHRATICTRIFVRWADGHSVTFRSVDPGCPA